MTAYRVMVLLVFASLTAVLSAIAAHALSVNQDINTQHKRWAANRAETTLNRELLRIVTELSTGDPLDIYKQYGAYQQLALFHTNPQQEWDSNTRIPPHQVKHRTMHELSVFNNHTRRLKAAADTIDTSAPEPRLAIIEEIPFLVIPTPDTGMIWVIPWDKIAAQVEHRSAIRITTIAAESTGPRLTLGSPLQGTSVWLHENIWSNKIQSHENVLLWLALRRIWTFPPSMNVPVLALLGLLCGLGLVALYLTYATQRTQETAAAEARDNLLQRISHELRTPASTVLSISGVLEDSTHLSNEERTQFFGLLREEAGRLASGMDRLLRAARGELDTKYDPIEMDLTEWLDGVSQRWLTRLPDMSLTLPPHPLMVNGDPERLDEAIDAILDNAQRYGGDRVTLRLHRTARGIRVEIDDDGPGVPSGDRTAIFQKLVRGSQQQAGGFGLGLWAAREVAEAHRGTLTLEDTSRFVLTLPGAR